MAEDVKKVSFADVSAAAARLHQILAEASVNVKEVPLDALEALCHVQLGMLDIMSAFAVATEELKVAVANSVRRQAEDSAFLSQSLKDLTERSVVPPPVDSSGDVPAIRVETKVEGAPKANGGSPPPPNPSTLPPEIASTMPPGQTLAVSVKKS